MLGRLSRLELLLIENVIHRGWVRVHLCHIVIHIGDVFVHVDDFILVLLVLLGGASSAPINVHVIHVVVGIDINHYAGLSCIRGSRLKPSILKFNFLDCTGC